MKALITGVTGYIGGRLGEILDHQGHKVYGMSRVPFSANHQVKQVVGNLAHPESLIGVTKGMDVVFHLGGGMRPSDGDLHAVNVEGTKQLIKDAIDSDVKRFIFMSAAAVYGDVAHPPAKEKDLCTPLDGHLYAVSKWDAEKELLERADQGTTVTILRPSQVYSAGSPAIMRLPKLASMVEGKNKTHFVHRDDVCNAAIFLANHPQAYGIYNIADHQPLSLVEAAKVLKENHDDGKELNASEEKTTIPPMLRKIIEATLVLDTTRIRDLGFKIQYPSLKEGILQK
ncbi:MAG TPA: NAD(P)-dependent oxidoreductase [Bacillales bacterium]|nr:NAD(P)-dependent oxidoreductase [Bacillales bacterium]